MCLISTQSILTTGNPRLLFLVKIWTTASYRSDLRLSPPYTEFKVRLLPAKSCSRRDPACCDSLPAHTAQSPSALSPQHLSPCCLWSSDMIQIISNAGHPNHPRPRQAHGMGTHLQYHRALLGRQTILGLVTEDLSELRFTDHTPGHVKEHLSELRLRVHTPGLVTKDQSQRAEAH